MKAHARPESGEAISQEWYVAGGKHGEQLLDKPEDWLPAENDKVVAALQLIAEEVVDSVNYHVKDALSSDEHSIAITAVSDEAKGEALVLLASVEIDQAELRAKLTEAGLPNLWIPRRVQRVDAIPTLASGKLDLKACRAAAEL